MKKIEFIALVIAVVFFAQLLFFYRGVYSPQPVNWPDFMSININSSKPIEIEENFTKGSGTVLVDLSHRNNLSERNMNLLFSKVMARGYDVDYLRDSTNLPMNLSNSSAFVVISPKSLFSKDEVKSVKEFTERGGKLLMLSEPILENEINSLATGFGILFRNDYLYNLKENDGNFKYIYLTDFKDNNITRGLHKIVFYTSSSVFGNGIIFTNNTTYSSSNGDKGRYSVAVMTDDSQTLAIGDITFLSEPYNVMDNNRLIENIADFLAPQASKAIQADITLNATNMSNASISKNETIKIPSNATISNMTNKSS